ncbi:adenylate cyclase [Corallococcus coralloides DSM 2259]|uniref:Adenylate cyclase n=1 Tax=Corallococcus coralloides (strain ATCC 25202 / DSM 2259 / NBRC 100086 / M2) TaxID=1144275 RepID=H8MM72_CORCM|nr:adenylate cyclase [Corallococcus coralloides DSM 2259]
MKIGRTSENDLVLHDHGVSRRHARITARDGRYFAEDVGSANGTQLNGQPLSGEKQLRDGDRITVGPVEFTFVWMPPEDDDDVTRPIRRALAPPNAKVSPQGLEQASLAEIEAAPTSYQQSMPAMARPASPPRPGMAMPAAKGGATPAMPMPAATPKRPSAPDLPAVSAPAPVAAAPARTPPVPVLGASAPGTAAPPKPPAGPPVLGASAPGAVTSPKPPVLGASAPGAATPPRPPAGPPVLGASASAASGKVPAAPPVLGASAPGAAAPPKPPVGPPVLGASASAASGKVPAAPPVLGPAVPGVGAPAKAPGGPPALSASTANTASGASASVRASGPGLAAVGASGPGRPSAPEPAHITALELPAAGTPASMGAAHAATPAPEKVAAPVPAKQNAVANLPGVGAPALNRPSLGLGAARASAAPAARGAAASSPGLPLMTPPGLMAPPPPARPSVAPPPVDLASVVPDEPEERTLMAIASVDSPVPAAAPPPVLPLPELDEPEEHTLMAIASVDSPVPAGPPPVLPPPELDEPEERTLMAIASVDSPVSAAPPPVLPLPELDEPEERTLMAIPATPVAPPLEKAPPPQDASPALLPPAMEEPEERTVLDLRPITPVSPLVAPPVRVVSAPAAAIDSSEPSTFVGQDDDLSLAPEETRASGTFTGQVAPGTAAPAVAPPPEPVTFVGRERAAPAPTLNPGPLPGETPLLARAPAPNGEGEATQSVPADREDSFVQPVPNGPVTVVAKVEPSSAADKARRRRQLARSLQGQLVLFWQRQSLPKRIGFASLAAVAVLAVVTLLVALVSPTAIRLPGREPFKLGMEPVTDSFGLGEGVRWVHADDKLFDFRFVSPTRAVAVLHYQASNIARDEVNLSLNGVSLGWVPPDTAQTAERELEQILPPSLLRRNANNQLLFDNALNPPGRDPWRIWNLRLEIIPVPEASPEQLVLDAREYAKSGARFYELKDVGAENLFKAWKDYRSAWITLEALDEKPELYEDVRERIAQISTELDHRCSQLMMQFQRAVQFRSRRDAVATLEDVRRRFPTAEHRCHNLAQEKAYEHEL